MIDVSSYIDPELIMADLKSKTKEDAIRLLVNKIFQVCPEYNQEVAKDALFKELIARERLQTTGLGQKMAFPHARIKHWPQFTMVIGISREGIDFNSLDGFPVNIVCLMVSSEDEPYIVLQAMAAFIRFAQETKIYDKLFDGMDSTQIADEFKRYRLSTTSTIRASDIMRPVKVVVSLDTPLEKVSRLMHLHHLDVLPVLEKDDKLVGQISCFEIFSLGIPDFFKSLHTVSFVRHIDPFEKYFKIKKDMKTEDIFKGGCSVIPHDATLIEIIFQLTVKNEPKLFVVKDEKLVGELDRFSIIDKILFF